MSTTLAEARQTVRRQLEDTSGAPLWADADIDDGLRAALSEYGQWQRGESTLTQTLAEGEQTIAMPGSTLAVARVTAPGGRVIPRRSGEPRGSSAGEELAWEWWGGEIRFTAPPPPGAYEVRFLAARMLPAAPGDALPARPGDVPLLVAGAVLRCLERRMVEEWKRGALPVRYEIALRRAEAAYRREWDARRRTVRVSHAVSGS